MTNLTPDDVQFITAPGLFAPPFVLESAYAQDNDYVGSVITAALPRLYGPTAGPSGLSHQRLARTGGRVDLDLFVSQSINAPLGVGTVTLQVSINGAAWAALAVYPGIPVSSRRHYRYTTPASFNTLDFRAVSTANAVVTSMSLCCRAQNT